jgi:hypothetical protein
VKPEFFRDRKIAQAGPVIALVYEALWCIADDFGTAPCDPVQVKGEMFVYWPTIGVPEIAGALRHLCGTSRVKLFMVGDQLFARICNWSKHQKPHRPSAFRHPTTGQEVRWDGDAPVPHDSGTSEAPVASFDPVVLSSSYSNGERAEKEQDPDGEVAFLAKVPKEKRATWRAILKGWREGLGTPRMKPFTDDDIRAGLLEYIAKTGEDRDFSPQHVVTFPEGIRQRRELGPMEPRPAKRYPSRVPDTKAPPRGGSPPVKDDAPLCGICGTRETEIKNSRIVPKHKDGCALAVATAGIGR